MEKVKNPKTGRKYQAVCTKICADILGGVYQKGSSLPSQRTLMKKYNVSLGTIRQSVEMLKKSNVLEIKQGSGMYITASDGDIKDIAGHLVESESVGYLWVYHTLTEADTYKKTSKTYSVIMHSVMSELQRLGKRPFVAFYDRNCKIEDCNFADILKEVDSIIVTGEVDASLLAELKTNYCSRIVVAGHVFSGDNPIGISCVEACAEVAGSLAVNLLSFYGHKNIAILTEGRSKYFLDIQQGFLSASHKLGMLKSEVYTISNLEDEKEIANKLAKLEDITAVVVIGDTTAERLMANWLTQGCHCPSDKSMVVIGGLPASDLLFDFTVIDINYSGIGKEAVRLAVQNHNGGSVHSFVPLTLRNGSTLERCKV